MSKIPPKKRKQSGKSLKLICRKLGLPYRKAKRRNLADAHNKKDLP